MKERDDKQWCTLIGWIRFLCFDLLPPHYSGGSDRCVSVEVFVAFLNNVNKFLGCYKGGKNLFTEYVCFIYYQHRSLRMLQMQMHLYLIGLYSEN